MNPFQKLHALRAFERQHLDFFKAEDYRIIGQIGFSEAEGTPIPLKQMFLSDIGSVATVQRRLRRLKERGFVQNRRVSADHREVQLILTPRCRRMFAEFDKLMTGTPDGPRRHTCGLCNSDARRRNLLATHLAQGLKRGDQCLLVAPAEARDGIVGELRLPRNASDRLLVSEGYDSVDAQFAFLKRTARAAAQSGRALCLAADMSWTLPRRLGIDAVLEIETRFDAFASQSPSLSALCVYDTRHFSGGEFLRAAKCHRDHSRHPIMLG